LKSLNKGDTVVLAELVRPRGNKGEVLAISQTDVPGRLEALKQAWITGADGQPKAIEIEEVWPHNEYWVLKFAGVDSISAAQEFKGKDLWVPRIERAPLPEGEYFRTDLIGCSVVETSGATLGKVEGWQQYGGPPLIEIKVRGKEVLIPFVEAICRKVDLENRVIEVDLPEGLLEL
jgi:16S rRNA processing protein RimM